MNFLNRGIQQAVAVFALVVALPAGAQENLDHGKSPVQLFASDCAICHKSVQGLGKAGGLFGLESFLRQHYTASRESAAAIAAYLKAVDTGPAEPAKRTRRAKGSDRPKGEGGKTSSKKPDGAKSEGAKPAEAKPADAKPADAKPAEAKPAVVKPTEAAPAEAKPIEAKVEAKPVEPKAIEAKPSEAKPAESAKPSESAKPD